MYPLIPPHALVTEPEKEAEKPNSSLKVTVLVKRWQPAKGPIGARVDNSSGSSLPPKPVSIAT